MFVCQRPFENRVFEHPLYINHTRYPNPYWHQNSYHSFAEAKRRRQYALALREAQEERARELAWRRRQERDLYFPYFAVNFQDESNGEHPTDKPKSEPEETTDTGMEVEEDDGDSDCSDEVYSTPIAVLDFEPEEGEEPTQESSHQLDVPLEAQMEAKQSAHPHTEPSDPDSDHEEPSTESSTDSQSTIFKELQHEQQEQTKTQLSMLQTLAQDFQSLQAAFSLPDQSELLYSSLASNGVRKLLFDPANRFVWEYYESLQRLLEKLDQVESFGSMEVRRNRKRLVQLVNSALEQLDTILTC